MYMWIKRGSLKTDFDVHGCKFEVLSSNHYIGRRAFMSQLFFEWKEGKEDSGLELNVDFVLAE